MSRRGLARTLRSGVNALFVLACGCIMDGCHDSQPGRHFAEHGPNAGSLICLHHGQQNLINVASLKPLTPLVRR